MGATAMRRRQEDRTALSEQRMTDAAIALLVEKGIGGTTLALIGERAGYSRGLVTHHFGSKAGLLAHVHDHVAAAWVRRVEAVVGDATGIVALQRVTDALLGFIREEPAGLRAMYLLRYASIDPGAEFRANVARVNEAHVRFMTRWIREGQKSGEIDPDLDAATTSRLFASTVDGILYRWFIDPAIDVESLHAQLRAHIEHTLRAT